MHYSKPITFYLIIALFSGFVFGQKITSENSPNSDSVKLSLEELIQLSQLVINEEEIPLDSDNGALDFFILSTITQQEFETGLTKAAQPIIFDTTKVRKKNGVIQLICKNTTRKFVDYIPDATDYAESIQTFEYVGSISCLNAYVVLGIYWEWYEYKLIDKTTGEEIATFNELPHISPDKKNILCISSNPYEMTADLSYYSLVGTKIIPIASMCFSNWMAAEYSEHMYWGHDGAFYVGINSIANFWDKTGDTNLPKQFIRFTRNNLK